ncbi:MAG: polysaccharide biosynthesis protein, partial [Clostridia bacterium]|nr:polysaccharide biosynthesis protein [Clostridia bacterium]
YLINVAFNLLDYHLFHLFNFILCLLTIIILRIIYKVIYDYIKTNHLSPKNRTMIIGAGIACKALLLEMQNKNYEYLPICLIDDDMEKRNRNLSGIPVYGPTDKIPYYVNKYNIQTIIIAIPSFTSEQRKRIVNICNSTVCEVKIIPYLHNLINQSTLLSQTQNINIEDLLGRPPIIFNDCNCKKIITDKVCLVTGGGGSIGSELCRQIIKYNPQLLVIVDIYENNAYDIQQELILKYGSKLKLNVQIASVRDYKKLEFIFKQFNPDIVFHAAAHKHVPLMEANPEEAIKNNVVGTFNTATLANKYNCKKFVLISSDKAVNPTNAMGATKRCCEMIIQYLGYKTKNTEYVAVRFGNVLGSNGSVIPLFEKQIKNGGPVTITHPDIIRYFMTIPEAVSLVLEAGAMAKGGEIFILDMGEPVKIVTLAENLIKLHGYKPYKDIKIEYVGLRPGEKLYEELLMNEEGLKQTFNKKIFISQQKQIDYDKFYKDYKDLKLLAFDNNTEKVLLKLNEMVPNFKRFIPDLNIQKEDSEVSNMKLLVDVNKLIEIQ